MKIFMEHFIITGLLLIPSILGGCPHEQEGLSKWSDPATWPNNEVPTAGLMVEINKPILLDTNTERLNGVTLVEGGKLIFSPNHETSLTTENVLIEHGGEMWVGSEDCPFEAETEIMLTGEEYDDELGHPVFGIKFIGVKAGGTLEIHGQQNRLPFTKLAETLHPNYQKKATIKVRDDITSWRAGDRVIISTSHYDMRNTETYTIDEILDANTLVLARHEKHRTLYPHYGEVWETIDMAAEVALLTRNIKIHGEVRGEPCTLYDYNHCQRDPLKYELTGGHIMTVEGFKSSTVNGAEVYHMGQFDTLGRYPIHYHMALDSRRNGRRMTVSGNSIHDTFSRCITIHGTHHLLVENNVAVNHFGHCYFLEDGGEKYNSFINNIGMSTKRHALTPGDNSPTTFWITSPLTEVVGNVAAGSDTRKGFGFWFLFPDEPVGPSRPYGFFGFEEAAHTATLEIRDNTAHSNGDTGFAFFRRLNEDHGLSSCLNYFPRVNVSDGLSAVVPIEMNGITAFKNRNMNVMMRSGIITMKNLKVSDSVTGIELSRAYPHDGYGRLKDAVIAGWSPTWGSDQATREVIYNNNGIVYPQPWAPQSKVRGVSLDAEGPNRLENITFLNFQRDQNREASAIFYKWSPALRRRQAASTWSKDLKFNYDESEGFYIYESEAEATRPSDEKFKYRTSIQIRDLDGSLTGEAGVTVTKRDQLWTEGHDCRPYVEGSNLDICEAKYAGSYIHPWNLNPMQQGFAFFMNTGEIMQNLYETAGYYHKIKTPDMPQTLDSFDILITNINNTFTRKFEAMLMMGLDKGDQVIAGICVPMSFARTSKPDSELFEGYATCKDCPEYSQQAKENFGLKSATSLEDLAESTDPSVNYFFDMEMGVVYRRFWETKERKEHELSDCISDGNIHWDCPRLTVLFYPAEQDQNVDYSDLNCLERFGYPSEYESFYY